MELSQIKGIQQIIQSDFVPIPVCNRLKEVANKTTIIVGKPYGVDTLSFIHPVTKEMLLCEPINSGDFEFELNTRDATNPFRVLVTYDYVNHTVVVKQSPPAATPDDLEKGPNELFISSFIEQAQGTQQPVVDPLPVTNYFRWKALTKAAGSYNDIVDFTYSKVYLTITGNITILNPAFSAADITIPDGKTLMLCIRGSANTITWGSNFVQTDNSMPLSTLTTKWNKVIITKNEVSGKYEWCNTDTVTA